MAQEKFWLYDWIDTLEIKDVAEAEKLLKEIGLRKNLRKRIDEIPFALEKIPATDAPTLVAGRAIDLSGDLDCSAWECMQKQVDKLFSHAWHYFDQIVVVGPCAYEFSKAWNEKSEPRLIERLLTYVRLLLYIRDIGAEDLLLFRQKRPPCQVHLEEHLKEVGMEHTLGFADEWIEQITSKAEINIKKKDDYFEYAFNHPQFEHTIWGNAKKLRGQSEKAFYYSITEAIFKGYLATLASDVWSAQKLGSPLGSTVNFHGQILNSLKVGIEESDVAFELNLPILNGISPEFLLKIRNDEKASFEKFRQSLRLAIKEQIKNSSNEKASKIADEIRKDIINPALSDIELRLLAAQKVVAKKIGLGLTLGGIVTTCGLLTLNPITTAAGITAMMGSAYTAGHKFIEENRDIALSDMYFLWQVQKHSEMHIRK